MINIKDVMIKIVKGKIIMLKYWLLKQILWQYKKVKKENGFLVNKIYFIFNQ